MDPASWTQALVGGIIAYLVLKVVQSFVNNVLLSPLRDLPGPLPATVTSRWLGTISFAGHRASYLHSLHQRYGDVVRVGPNEVSFASAAAARDIYLGVDVDLVDAPQHVSSERESFWRTRRKPGSDMVTVTKTFPKSPLYDTLGQRNVFRMRDEEEHRQRLKRVGHAFSPTLMPDVERVMHAETANLLRAMERYRGRPINLMHWFRMLSFDIVGRLFLGTHFESLKGDEAPAFIHYLDTAIPAWFLHRHYRLLHDFLISLPIKSLRDFLSSGRKIYEWSGQCLDDFIARYGRHNTRRLPLSRLLAGNADAGLAPLPDAAIVPELTLMLFAGTDTSGNTLAYLFYELACHPEWLARLRAELAAAAAAHRTAPAASRGAHNTNMVDTRASGAGNNNNEEEDVELGQLSHDELQDLPVLNAVIWETLRAHPVVPAQLSRVAPKGGAPVAGHFMPAGTLVAVPPYTLQRQAHVFPEPDAWRPERWLAPDAAPAAAASTSPAYHATENQAAATAPADARSGNGRANGQGNAANAVGGARGGGGGGGDGAGGGGDKIDGARGASDAMRAHMLVFSRGARSCLGRAIAMMELRLATAAVAQRFATVRLASAQTRDDMQMTDHFLLLPKGRKCMLIFE